MLLMTIWKSILSLFATHVIRELYFEAEFLKGFRAKNETIATSTTSNFRWYFAKLFSCQMCITYWISAIVVGMVWFYPLLFADGFFPEWPSVLLGILIIGFIVNALHPVAGAAARELEQVKELQEFSQRLHQTQQHLDSVRTFNVHPGGFDDDGTSDRLT